MKDFPRSTMRHEPKYGAVAYLPQRPLPPWVLDPDAPVASVTDTKVINRSRLGRWVTVEFGVKDVQFLGDAAEEVVRASGIIRESLVNDVEGKKLVVMPDYEPEYKIRIEVHVQGTIDAWPRVPGVTAEPYEEFDRARTPYSIAQFDALWESYQRARRDHYEVRLRMNPMALNGMRRREFAQYFDYIDTDHTMNPEWVSIVVRVA